MKIKTGPPIGDFGKEREEGSTTIKNSLDDIFKDEFFSAIEEMTKTIMNGKKIRFSLALVEAAQAVIDETDLSELTSILDEENPPNYTDYEVYKKQLIKDGLSHFEACQRAGEKYGG